MTAYKCHKCDSVHTTGNMVAWCANCVHTLQTKVKALEAVAGAARRHVEETMHPQHDSDCGCSGNVLTRALAALSLPGGGK